MGTCCAGWHAGTVRCRWAHLPRVDPLCDRMERGEEEAVRAAAMHFSAAIFADVQARSFRRAAAENCRPAIFEARATLREQSGSTLGRRERRPGLSPFARNRGMSPLHRVPWIDARHLPNLLRLLQLAQRLIEPGFDVFRQAVHVFVV